MPPQTIQDRLDATERKLLWVAFEVGFIWGAGVAIAVVGILFHLEILKLSR